LIDLRTIVYQKLSPLCEQVYYQEAPQACVLPYAVFSFPSSNRVYKEQRQYELEVTIYYAEKNGYNVASSIDALTEQIISVLDYKTGDSSDLSAWFKFEQRLEVPFPDGSHLWGRQLRFTAYTYEE